MVAKDQNVKAAWSEVDVQLERRARLIPNLGDLKGFTRREHRVRRHRQCARGMLNAQGPAAKIAANGQLDGALGRLLLLTENYPQLRSSDQFMRLQDELAGTENGSAWPGSAITMRCRTTTRLSCSSRTAFGRDGGYAKNDAYFTASPAAQAFHRLSSSRTLAHTPERPSRPAGWPFWNCSEQGVRPRLSRSRGYLKEAMALASSSLMSKTV